MSHIPSQHAGVAAAVMAEHKANIAQPKAPYVSKYGLAQKEGSYAPFLSPKRLAELLGISVKTLERMRADGSGPAYKKFGNKRIAYFIPDVDAWLDTCGPE